MHPHFKSSETGRSLLELLLIIVVMALLTISAIMGFQTLSTKVATQSVSKTIERYVVERRHEAMTTIGHTPHEVLDIAGPHGVVFDISNDIENNLIVIKTKSHNKNLIRVLGGADILRADAYSIDPPVIADVESFVIMRFKQYPTGGLDVNSAVTCPAGEVCDQCTDSTKPVWNGVKCVCNATSCDGTSPICSTDGICICPDNATCENGNIIPDVGYYLDGDETKPCSNDICEGCQLADETKPYWNPTKEECRKLPIEYQEVEWIGSTGTQYIDTGLVLPQGFKSESEVMITSYSGSGSWLPDRFIGSHNGSAPYNRNHHSFINEGTTVVKAELASGGVGYYASTQRLTQNVFFKYEVDNTTNVPICKVNGSPLTLTNQGGTSGSGNRATYSIYIMATNQGGTAYPSTNLKFKYVKIRDKNNVLLRHFIPCYRKSDDKTGAYDIENGVFYPNIGTGEFIKGPDVQ